MKVGFFGHGMLGYWLNPCSTGVVLRSTEKYWRSTEKFFVVLVQNSTGVVLCSTE